MKHLVVGLTKLNMHSFYSILFLLVVFICSCSDAVDVNRDIKVIPVDFENYESVSMSDLFTKIEVIELEGNSESYLNSPSSLEITSNPDVVLCYLFQIF